MNRFKLHAGAVVSVLALGLVGCAPADEGPEETITNLDGDAPLSDHDSLYEGWPGNGKLPSEGKADDVYPKKYTDLLALQSPIRNQSSRGVCSIFSGVGIMEHLYIKEGTILEPDFSEEFLQWSAKVELRRFANTEGSNSNANLAAINQFGIVTEADWPYLGRRWSTSDDAECEGDDLPTKCYTHGSPPESAMNAERWHLPRGRWISSRRNSVMAHMTTKKEAVVVGGTFFYQSWNHRKSELPHQQRLLASKESSPPPTRRTKPRASRSAPGTASCWWAGTRTWRSRNATRTATSSKRPRRASSCSRTAGARGSFGADNEHGDGYGWISMAYVEDHLTAYVSGTPERRPRRGVWRRQRQRLRRQDRL